MSRPSVVIYSNHMLPLSQGFVVHQGNALSRYRPVYLGSRAVEGISVPEAVLINDGALGRLRELYFKLTRRPPADVVAAITSEDPVLLHAHMAIDGVLIAPTARRLRLPMLTTFHGLDFPCPDQSLPMLTRLYLRRRRDLHSSSALLAVSEYTKRRMVEHHFNPDRIIVHYVGVDTAAFAPDPAIQREPILLFVGRFAPEKGCRYFVEAAALATQAMPGIRVVMIGDGPCREEAQSLATERRVSIDFLGRQPLSQVRHWMQRARVLCAPSTVVNGDAEAFGLVFMEAQASGLPAVSFAVGGVPESIAHGVTGLLAPDRDVPALAKHVLQLFGDEAVWQAFSHAGRSRAVESFDLHKQTEKLEAIYSSVIEAWRAQADSP